MEKQTKKRLEVALVAVIILSFGILGGNIFLQAVGAINADKIDLTADPLMPPVITYRPETLSVDHKSVSPKSLIEKLEEVGLSETPRDRTINPGGFRFDPPVVTFRPDFPDQPDLVRITFKKDKVSEIEADGVAVSTVALPPKAIATFAYTLEEADDETVIRSFPETRVILRSGDLDDSVIKDVICASEGGCDSAVSLAGIIRAALTNLEKKLKDESGIQGGSGICMQLIKNVSGDSSRTLSRKFNEFATCNDLAQRLPPNEMLEVWANFAYLGEAKTGRKLRGVQTATTELFGVSARNADLNQSVFIAALVPEPRLLRKLWQKNPDLAAWKKVNARRSNIADNLANKYPGKFTPQDLENATTWKPKFTWDGKKQADSGDRFNFPIIQLAGEDDEVFRSKLDVKSNDVTRLHRSNVKAVTQIDEGLNIAARRILLGNLDKVNRKFPPVDGRTKKRKTDSLIGTLAVMDNRTGQLLTVAVASSDPKTSISKKFLEHGVFPASQSKTAPYGCALEEKLITLSGFIDPKKAAIRRLDGTIWRPQMGVGGRIKTVAEAQASSDDGAVVVVADLLGLERVAHCWERFSGNAATPNISAAGEREYPPTCSLGFCAGMETSALGLLSGYSALGNNGVALRPRLLVGKSKPAEPTRTVLSEEAAYLQVWALQNVVGKGPFGNFGTAAKLPFFRKTRGHNIACKTGSGAAAVGITCVTPNATVTVQFFYANNGFFRQTKGYAFAADTVGPALSEFLIEVKKRRPELLQGRFEVPPGIAFVRIDLSRNCQDRAGVEVPFIRGTEPRDCDTDASFVE